MYIEAGSMDLLHVHQLIFAWLVYGMDTHMSQLNCFFILCSTELKDIYIFRSFFGSSVQYQVQTHRTHLLRNFQASLLRSLLLRKHGNHWNLLRHS